MLWSACDFGSDVEFAEATTDVFKNIGQIDIALWSTGGNHVIDFGVSLWVKGSETKIFKLLLEFLHAEAMSKWCIDVESFLRRAMLLPCGHCGNGPHVVKSISELDDEDAEILRHRHEHFANCGCLLCFFAIELDAIEFCDAVNNSSDVLTEFFLDIDQRCASVFHRIVQKRCSNCDVIKAKFGTDLGNCNRVRDIGLARFTGLTFVRSRRPVIGTRDQRRR